MDDKQRYKKYVTSINKMLASEEFYESFRKRLRAAKPNVTLQKKKRTKQFDMTWIDTIEECIPNLDNIVRNPRKFIVIEEDIVDISLARSISTESVKHLAQHTNLIASVDKEGNVTPNKILNTTKEESFEIYENRFIYTLLKNISNFVSRRMDAIKAAYVNDRVLELDVDASLFTGKTRVFYNLELIGSLPTNEEENIENAEDMAIVERVSKLQRIINDFLGSPFAKQMVSSAPVRPPITRTNVILKNPDFKKALVLWQFIESYSKMGFTVENKVDKLNVEDDVNQGVFDMIALSSTLMDSMIDGVVDDAEFYSEANMDEENIEEPIGGEEDAEGEKEGEKEKEIEGEEPDMDDTQDTQENIDIEDDEVPEDQRDLSEVKNLFQRTSDESQTSKAEIQRINKAIDRVLMAASLQNAELKSELEKQKHSAKEIDQSKLIAQLEKEKKAIERAMQKKLENARREQEARERALEREKKRLEQLEEDLRKGNVEVQDEKTANEQSVQTEESVKTNAESAVANEEMNAEKAVVNTESAIENASNAKQAIKTAKETVDNAESVEKSVENAVSEKQALDTTSDKADADEKGAGKADNASAKKPTKKPAKKAADKTVESVAAEEKEVKNNQAESEAVDNADTADKTVESVVAEEKKTAKKTSKSAKSGNKIDGKKD